MNERLQNIMSHKSLNVKQHEISKKMKMSHYFIVTKYKMLQNMQCQKDEMPQMIKCHKTLKVAKKFRKEKI